MLQKNLSSKVLTIPPSQEAYFQLEGIEGRLESRFDRYKYFFPRKMHIILAGFIPDVLTQRSLRSVWKEDSICKIEEATKMFQ